MRRQMTDTARPRKLPEHVRFSHGAYYYVRWNGQLKRVIWKRLGADYAQMLQALGEVHQDEARAFASLLDRFEREETPKTAPGTRRQHRWQLKALRQSFGAMTPEAIKPKHVYRFLDEYGKRSPASANNCVGLLSHVFATAIRWGIVEHNPALHIKKHELPKRDRYLTDAEYAAILEAAPPWAMDVLEMAYLTGQRIGDVLGLEWRQVRADGIHFQQQKTGNRIIVEFSPRLERVINRCRLARVMGRTVLADERGQARGYRRVARMFGAAVKAAGIEPYATLHDLRRKAASDSAPESELLGHKDGRMRAVYRVKPKRAKPPA